MKRAEGARRSEPKVRVALGRKLIDNVELRTELEEFRNHCEEYNPDVTTSDSDAALIETVSMRSLGHVFGIMDDMHDILQDLLNDWEPPQVMVIGHANTGKSTILERLCMMPLFPHDRRVCTRMAIRVKVCVFCVCKRVLRVFVCVCVYNMCTHTHTHTLI